MASKVANATNSVGLWPGSVTGGLGFGNLLEKTKHHFAVLFWPTLLGSLSGAALLLSTPTKVFDRVIPGLILVAALLLLFQPKVKSFVLRKHERLPAPYGWGLQFLVSAYGGYFGAGMGIMMLASFALYMDGTIHELNAVKNWLGLVINFSCSAVFIAKGLVELWPAIFLVIGSLIGGYFAARLSQKANPDKFRLVIAIYGIGMSLWFAYRAFA